MQRKKKPEEKACNKGKIKISILIPAYNNEKVIGEAIESALKQKCPFKEIIVVDDCSTDNTVKVAQSYPGVKVYRNEENSGIGVNLAIAMTYATAPYVIYLCGDDVFADENVCSDVCDLFDTNHKLGVIDRIYHQFVNGYPGACTRVEEENIYLSTCCPSGVAFRKMKVWGANRIFIEMPLIVVQYLQKGYEWARMNYDTVAVRIHPGGNTGTFSSYYKESPTKVYTEFLGKPFDYYPIFIQLKNRAPHILMEEIKIMKELNPACVKDKLFWGCVIMAVITPTWLLRHLSAFYRHRINRRKAYIVKRSE